LTSFGGSNPPLSVPPELADAYTWGPRRFRTTIVVVEIHRSARKHGIADEDIEHAAGHAMTIENQDDTRLYLGPSRSAALLEVVTIVRDDDSELAIHAMPMRAKYQRLLPGG
jgi:hypothetical protein